MYGKQVEEGQSGQGLITLKDWVANIRSLHFILKCTGKPLKGFKIGYDMICVFKSSLWLSCGKGTMEEQERKQRELAGG